MKSTSNIFSCILWVVFSWTTVMASSAQLSLTPNGTYTVQVIIDSQLYTMLVDMRLAGVWLPCSAIDGPDCLGEETKTEGRTITPAGFYYVNESSSIKSKRVTLEIGDWIDTDAVLTVVYNTISKLPSNIDGVLGVSVNKNPLIAAPLNQDGSITTLSFQVAESSNVSKIGLNIPQGVFVDSISPQTAITVPSQVWALSANIYFSLFSKNSSRESYGGPLNPVCSSIVLTYEAHYVFKSLIPHSCEPVMISYGFAWTKVGYYVCETTSYDLFPRLVIEHDKWQLFLDPEDYITKSSGRLTVLVGEADSVYGVLSCFGAPFLRKFPVYYNDNELTVYCKEGESCERVDQDKVETETPQPSASGVSIVTADASRVFMTGCSRLLLLTLLAALVG